MTTGFSQRPGAPPPASEPPAAASGHEAIDWSNLYQAHGRQMRQAMLVGDVGEALTRDDTLEAMLQSSAEAVVKHLGAAFARIWIVDERRRELLLRASAGRYTHLDGPHSRIPVGKYKIGAIAATAEPHLTNDICNDPAVGDKAWARDSGMVAFAGYPLLVEGRVVGVMAMFATAALEHDTLCALASVADAVALGIERKRAILAQRAVEGELREAVERLEKANAELDQFAYVASHDLRAPLRGIANLSHWIEDDLGDRMTDHARQQMEKLRGRVHRLEALIDGILRYSRVGRTRETPERVDVGRLVKEVVELLAPPAHAAIVVAPGLPVLTTERLLLEQVLMNLIGNALKYGDRASPRIEIGARDLGGSWELSVKDNGPGIPPQQQERIWGVFQTLHSRDDVESTGLGLAIVKKIVSAKGGNAWVDPGEGSGAPVRGTGPPTRKPGEGSGATFRFTWPKSMEPGDQP
jgi:signal transduction histidine kinase